MTPAQIVADLHAKRRFPTDEEAEQVAREGTLVEVGYALCASAGTNEVLRLRYARLFEQSRRGCEN